MADTHFPHSVLLFNGSKTLLVATGPHVQLIDATNGSIISSTLNASDDVKNSLSKSGPVRYIAVDSSQTHFLTFGDDKKLKVWKLEGLELLHERELPKRPTSACFTRDGQTILVADKFGDVFSYTLHPSEPEKTGQVPVSETPAPESEPKVEAEAEEKTSKKKKSKKQKQKENPPHPRDSTASHVNPSNGTLVLGHTSMLTSLLLTQDEKYVITTDRDEHIRVSWYPQGYIIESYCLGCSQFVSCLHIPPSQPSVLISGGGDPELKVWDWFSGQLKCNIPILDIVKEFIQVTAQPYVRKRAKQRANVANAGADQGTAEPDETMVDGTATPDEAGQSPAPGQLEEQPVEETVLVVQNITTIERHEKTFIVFSVVGASAIFVTELPSSSTPVPVQAIQFDHPVLDFAVDDTGLIWVTVDINLAKGSVSWEGKTIPLSTSSTEAAVPIRLVEVKSDGTLVEPPPASVSAQATAVLETLNSKCLVPGTSAELSTLNLYSSLVALPKNNRGEDGEGEDEGGEAKMLPQSNQSQSGRDLGPGKGRKEVGKMKSKLAVAEKKRLLEGGGKGDDEKPDEKPGEEAPSEERDSKRPRSEAGEGADVTMAEA